MTLFMFFFFVSVRSCRFIVGSCRLRFRRRDQAATTSCSCQDNRQAQHLRTGLRLPRVPRTTHLPSCTIGSAHVLRLATEIPRTTFLPSALPRSPLLPRSPPLPRSRLLPCTPPLSRSHLLRRPLVHPPCTNLQGPLLRPVYLLMTILMISRHHSSTDPLLRQ